MNCDDIKQKARESSLRYYRSHKKTVQARNAQWWEDHSDKLREKWKRHRERRKEKMREYRKAYREKNRERIAEKNRAWKKTVAGKLAGSRSVHCRRARKNGSVVDQSEISKWMKEIRGNPFARCHWCGTKISGKEIHFDHVVALSKGGSHTIGNLCSSCPECNQKKSSRLISDWICGGQSFLSL